MKDKIIRFSPNKIMSLEEFLNKIYYICMDNKMKNVSIYYDLEINEKRKVFLLKRIDNPVKFNAETSKKFKALYHERFLKYPVAVENVDYSFVDNNGREHIYHPLTNVEYSKKDGIIIHVESIENYKKI